MSGLVGAIDLASAQTWTQTTAPARAWLSMACSADGSIVAAVHQAVGGGQIFVSTNSGASWTATSAPLLAWTSVASSADGTRLAAVANNNGIYTSTNSGLTWTSNNVAAH